MQGDAAQSRAAQGIIGTVGRMWGAHAAYRWFLSTPVTPSLRHHTVYSGESPSFSSILHRKTPNKLPVLLAQTATSIRLESVPTTETLPYKLQLNNQTRGRHGYSGTEGR